MKEKQLFYCEKIYLYNGKCHIESRYNIKDNKILDGVSELEIAGENPHLFILENKDRAISHSVESYSGYSICYFFKNENTIRLREVKSRR